MIVAPNWSCLLGPCPLAMWLCYFFYMESISCSLLSCFVELLALWAVLSNAMQWKWCWSSRAPALHFCLRPFGKLPWKQQAVKELVWSAGGREPGREELKSQEPALRPQTGDWGQPGPPGAASTPAESSHMGESRWDWQKNRQVSLAKRNNKSLFLSAMKFSGGLLSTIHQSGNW